MEIQRTSHAWTLPWFCPAIRNDGNNGVNHAMDSESSVGPGKQVELTWNSYYLMLMLQDQRVNLLNENHHIQSEYEHLQKLLIMGSLAYYSGNWTFYSWKMQFNLDSNKSVGMWWMHMCVRARTCWYPHKPKEGITGSCDPPNIGDRNWTQIFCKSSKE